MLFRSLARRERLAENDRSDADAITLSPTHKTRTMATMSENVHPNQLGGLSPTSSESPARSFIDPMAMLMAAKNEGASEVDERAARALEQKLELQRRQEEDAMRVALKLQSEEDEALLLAAQQEENDLLVAQRAQEEEEAAAREAQEEKVRREQSDAELARRTSESLDKDQKLQEAKDSHIAEQMNTSVVLELHTAIRKKNIALITEFLKNGCDAGICLRHGETSSPLQLAVEANLPSVVKMLIAAKAPVDYADSKGDTALHWAATRKRMDCMKELVAGGANLDVQNKLGFTPIIAAAKAGYAEPIRLLVEKGANLYHKDKECKMALHHVPFLCRSLKTLLERMCGWALLEAAGKGRGNEVTDLIRKGASPRLSDDQLRTPLHHAAAGGHNIVVEFLLTQKSRINAVDRHGQTALHRAAASHQDLVVYTLLRHGADASVVDKSGQRAADYAAQSYNAQLPVLFTNPPSPLKTATASPTKASPSSSP